MVEANDERNAMKPFVFKSLYEPFSNGDGTVLAYCSDAVFDTDRFEKFVKGVACEHGPLIGDDVLRSSELLEGIAESVDGPCRVRAFQGFDRHGLPREVINIDQNIRRPKEPSFNDSQVHGPNVIRISSDDPRILAQ